METLARSSQSRTVIRRSSSRCSHDNRCRSRSSSNRRRSRQNKYHRLARRSTLSAIRESFDADNSESSSSLDRSNHLIRSIKTQKSTEIQKLILVNEARLEILAEMARSAGETTTPQAQKSINKLLEHYNPRRFSPHKVISKSSPTEGCQLEGTWITLSKAQFSDCLGLNENKDYMYTLGRLSFGMFRPSNLVCSIQGIFNVVDVVDRLNGKEVRHVPPSLVGDVREGKYPVRSYNIVTAFTIEPHQTKFGNANIDVDEPIECVMTTFGYLLPYPKQRDRFSIWFTGGKLEIMTDKNKRKQLFENVGKRSFTEKSRLFMATFLMGASVSDQVDANGMVSYQLTRPIPAYIDLLYLDEGLRIMRSSSGVVYVLARTEDVDDVSSIASGETSGSLSSCGRSDSSCVDTEKLSLSSVSLEADESSSGNRQTIPSPPRKPSRRVSPERNNNGIPATAFRPIRRDSSSTEVFNSNQLVNSCPEKAANYFNLEKQRKNASAPRRPSRCISPER